MQEKLNFKNAYQNFCRASADVLTADGRIAQLNSFLDIIITEYMSTTILISNNSKLKTDSLSFQYHEGECENESSQFIISLKRHICNIQPDEASYYGVKYCFKPSNINFSGCLLITCDDRTNIKQWIEQVRNSPGFVLAEGAKFSTLGIIIERPKK